MNLPQHGVLVENGPHRLIHLNAWSPVGIGRIRRYDCVGGGVPLEVSVEVSKAYCWASLVLSLPATCGSDVSLSTASVQVQLNTF